jgi:hypothetical protein
VSDIPTLVYGLALRSLDQQERELGELRARTNTLIAASALSSSFLGAAAINASGGVSGWAFAALLAFAATAALSLAVLWPREMSFVFDARETYGELYPLIDKISEAELSVAYSARDKYWANKKTIDNLEVAFQVAVVALGAQTLLWALALAVA